MVNIANEQIVTVSHSYNFSFQQTSDIIWKLLSIYDVVDQELAKLFVEKGGQDGIIEILLSKQPGPGSYPLIKILNGLVQVPQLINKLLDSGLAETVKLVNDLYADDVNILSMNFDTMRKISNQKNGRDFLVKKNLVPSLLNNIKKCADHENPQAVINGFSVLDNLSRDEAGKEAIKEANAMEILSDVLNTFDNDERVLKMGAKIYSKISKEEDMRQQLEIVKNCDKKIQTDPNQDNLKELEKALILVSNLMLVEDIGKVACEDDNYKMLMDLYDHICKLDLTGKSPDYLKTYTMLNKYFMVVFQRIFAAVPEILDKNSEKGKQSEGLFKNIQNSVIKIREGDQAGIDKLEADKDTTGGVEMLTKSFREYFTSFDDNLIQFIDISRTFD